MTKYTLEAIAFRYEELSEEAKQKAYLAWLAGQDQSLYSDEFRETLSKFEEIFQSKFVIGRLTATHSGIVL